MGMRRYFLMQLLAPLLCASMQKKGKQPKPADVRILAVSGYRVEGEVSIDGKLLVESSRPLRKLRLLIDFINTDRQVVTTKRGEVSEGELEAGDESEFQLRVTTPPGAISFTIRAEDAHKQDLRVESEGPYDIE